jgi:putative sterol carrier protein
VLLAPERASEIDTHICFKFAGHQQTGLHIRNCIAVPTDGNGAEINVECDIEAWADILAGDLPLTVALSQNKLTVNGDANMLQHALQVFDVTNLQT